MELGSSDPLGDFRQHLGRFSQKLLRPPRRVGAKRSGAVCNCRHGVEDMRDLVDVHALVPHVGIQSPERRCVERHQLRWFISNDIDKRVGSQGTPHVLAYRTSQPCACRIHCGSFLGGNPSNNQTVFLPHGATAILRYGPPAAPPRSLFSLLPCCRLERQHGPEGDAGTPPHGSASGRPDSPLRHTIAHPRERVQLAARRRQDTERIRGAFLYYGHRKVFVIQKGSLAVP